MQNRKIKIYSDKKYLTQENHEVILFPFWGKNKIELDRKILSELAQNHPQAFKSLVASVKDIT